MDNNIVVKYQQTRQVGWLHTPKGTIWRKYGSGNHIQPEDQEFWETLFGVDLDLLVDTEDENLFEKI